MQKTLAQARLSATIERSGMTDAQLSTLLEVNQSTISRLRHGKIGKVSRYQWQLDAHLGLSGGDRDSDLSELMATAQSSPALRETLVALQRLMRENA